VFFDNAEVLLDDAMDSGSGFHSGADTGYEYAIVVEMLRIARIAENPCV
jgi:hypothetical protein